jgi:hypothetical protein
MHVLIVCVRVGAWQIDAFRPNIPLVLGLRNSGMRDRHWADLSSEIGFVLKPDTSFTLTNVRYHTHTSRFPYPWHIVCVVRCVSTASGGPLSIISGCGVVVCMCAVMFGSSVSLRVRCWSWTCLFTWRPSSV